MRLYKPSASSWEKAAWPSPRGTSPILVGGCHYGAFLEVQGGGNGEGKGNATGGGVGGNGCGGREASGEGAA